MIDQSIIPTVVQLGSTAVAIFMCILFLKAMSEQRKDFTKTLETITTSFATKVEDISDKTIASNDRVEDVVRDLSNLIRIAVPQKNRP